MLKKKSSSSSRKISDASSGHARKAWRVFGLGARPALLKLAKNIVTRLTEAGRQRFLVLHSKRSMREECHLLTLTRLKRGRQVEYEKRAE
jgi:hypothetical protein